jgi:hypothetical protein
MNRVLTVAIAIIAILAVATTTINSSKMSVSAQQQVPDKDCAFNPSLTKCKPDTSGNCPTGFSHNANNNCIPNKCPSGFSKQDNDETGKCFSNKK